MLRPLNAVVCAKNMLPHTRPSDVHAYIVNTDNASQPGEHWVAIFFQRNSVYYFDSYGLPPLEDYIRPFIQRNSRSYKHNPVQLQLGLLPVCGLYCIFALDFLARDCDLDTILCLKFDPYPSTKNDEDVTLWFSRYYGQIFSKANSLPKDAGLCQCCLGHHAHGKETLMMRLQQPRFIVFNS